MKLYILFNKIFVLKNINTSLRYNFLYRREHLEMDFEFCIFHIFLRIKYLYKKDKQSNNMMQKQINQKLGQYRIPQTHLERPSTHKGPQTY